MKSVIEVLFEVLYRIYRKSLKGSLIFFLGMSFLGCNGGGSGSPESAAPDQSPGGGTSVAKTVTLKSGSNFDCFIWNEGAGEVWCLNDVPNGIAKPINFGPGGPGCSGNGSSCRGTDGLFIRVVSAASAITQLEVRDDTICWSLSVAQRPVSRDAGLGTYCIGEATINSSSLSGRTYVYGGPQYTDGANGSSDLTYAVTPFLAVEGGGAADLEPWGVFFASGPYNPDGESSVTEETLSCSLLEGTLTCPNFTVEVE